MAYFLAVASTSLFRWKHGNEAVFACFISHAVIAQPVRPEPAIVWGKLWTKWNMIWFSKAMLTADQIWHWSHWRRGRELTHSVLACRFYSVPFPSHESTEVLLVLCFNSLSLPLYTPSNSFKFRLSFAKKAAAFSRGAASFLVRTPCFWRCPSPEEWRWWLKTLTKKNTNGTLASNTTLLLPPSKVRWSRRMSFLPISGGFWWALHPGAARCPSTRSSISRHGGTLFLLHWAGANIP